MFRNLERCENTARLLEAGLRLGLTRSSNRSDDWKSVITSAGASLNFLERHDEFGSEQVIDFLLCDSSHPGSVLSSIEGARTNARIVRTALTREVWEATNEAWMSLTGLLTEPLDVRDLSHVLAHVRQESANVRGALHGTMMRNDIYDFCRLGTFVERADNTARILDVKYYLLLPSADQVGSRLDNVQWENILRSISAQRAYRWRNPGAMNPRDIADFVIFDRRMPRSLAFCFSKISDRLAYLGTAYDQRHPSHDRAEALKGRLGSSDIAAVFDSGLHEFLQGCINDTAALGQQIETDYQFAI